MQSLMIETTVSSLWDRDVTCIKIITHSMVYGYVQLNAAVLSEGLEEDVDQLQSLSCP